MNGRILPTGELETWPDNERDENLLIRADGSVGIFDPTKALRISGAADRAVKAKPLINFKTRGSGATSDA